MDDNIQDEIYVSSYQNKEGIGRDEEGGFYDDDPYLGTNISLDIDSYTIKYYRHIQMSKNQRKEIRDRYKLAIDHLHMTYQHTFIHKFKICIIHKTITFPTFQMNNLVKLTNNHL